MSGFGEWAQPAIIRVPGDPDGVGVNIYRKLKE